MFLSPIIIALFYYVFKSDYNCVFCMFSDKKRKEKSDVSEVKSEENETKKEREEKDEMDVSDDSESESDSDIILTKEEIGMLFECFLNIIKYNMFLNRNPFTKTNNSSKRS